MIFNDVLELAMSSMADRLEEALGDVGRVRIGCGRFFYEVAFKIEMLHKTHITRYPAALAHPSPLPQTPALPAYLCHTQTLASSVRHAWDLPSLLTKPVQWFLIYSLLLSTIHVMVMGVRINLQEAGGRWKNRACVVNEGRRRLEAPKAGLTGQLDAMNPPLKKLSTCKKAAISLWRIKGTRLTKSKEEGKAEHASSAYPNATSLCELAKDAVQAHHRGAIRSKGRRQIGVWRRSAAVVVVKAVAVW
ncbi:hypothetical protein BD410DRAFT_179043 [Rickenella mellea]|uniref:Uncharacterized protein n=1 Tax=Rickenella mellea TaxID=50990 RepID=A0A4Y7Q6S3_9AGAM|nr:hypothetical protein BD410DRAFT_179043 [Rickenella mellea]